MKKLSLEQMETTEGGKFWGSTYVCNESGVCIRRYTVLWAITWDTSDMYIPSTCNGSTWNADQF